MNAHTTSPFPIHIRALEGDFRPEERAFIRAKLTRRLGKFAESIERVSLRTEDLNGPRGGVDRVCRIKVVLRGLPSIVFEKQDAFMNTAVDLALAGVERGVRRALTRRRAKPLRRIAAAAPHVRS
jgi:ribosome-associated translation inhibitor RaiA